MALNPIDGTLNDDDIVGTTAGDLIHAGGGYDTVDAWDGDDRVYGEAGNDRISGGYGNDRLYGGTGADVILGGHGSDWLYGGSGNDFISAGDVYSTEIDHVWAGDGDDVIHVWPRNGGEIHGEDGFDRLDLFWYDNFGGGADITVTLNGPGAGAFTVGTSLTIDGIEAIKVLTYTGNDSVTGGDFDDDINVQAGANTVDGLGGNDRITYYSGVANDIDGGDGTDVVRIVSYSGILVFTVTGNSATDNFGSVIANVENYEVIGWWGNDEAYFGDGDDLFEGAKGNDLAEGNGGNDRLRGQGGNDTLAGGDADDRLMGGIGTDSLDGGNGHDVLTGGLGVDQMTGGEGADYFRFAALDEYPDFILDMEAGTDRILVTSNAIAGALPRGRVTDANFSLDAVSGSQPQFVYSIVGTEGHLYWDANGDGFGALNEIATFSGAPAISAGDITIII